MSIYFIAGGNIRIILALGLITLVMSSFLYVLGRYEKPEER